MNTVKPDVFINRKHELDVFKSLLREAKSAHYLFIVGGIGIGKSYLLERFRQICIKNSQEYIWVDFSPQNLPSFTHSIQHQLIELGKRHKNSEKAHSSQSVSFEFDDLPLFSGQSFPHMERTAISNLDYKLYKCAAQINVYSKKTKTVLFIDTIPTMRSDIRKLISSFLEHLNGKVLVVMATRHVTLPLHTIDKRIVTILKLQPFSKSEISEFLHHYGVVETEISGDVFEATKGIPLLAAEALAFISKDGFNQKTSEPFLHRVMIKNGLTEVNEHATREIIRLASILRGFNLEVLKRISKSQKLPSILDSLKEYSFIEIDDTGLHIAQQLRDSLIYEWQRNSPSRYIALNKRALDYYNKLLQTSDPSKELSITLSKIYHGFCINHKRGLQDAIIQFNRFEYLQRKDACQAIRDELVNFTNRVDNVGSWIYYCNAVLERLSYNWTISKSLFEKLLKQPVSMELRAHSLNGLAKTLWEAGEWKRAETISRRAGELFERFGKDMSDISPLIILGTLLIRQHRWDEALMHFNHALSVLPSTGEKLAEFQIQFGLADLFRSQGRWDASRTHLEKSLILAEELNSKSLQARVWHSFGKLYRTRQHWLIAGEHFRRSIELRKEIGDRLGQAQSLHSLGNVLFRAGNSKEAKLYLLESLRIKEEINDRFGIAKSLNYIGHINRLEGNWEDALRFYKASLQQFNDVNNQTKASRVMCRIGMTLASNNKVTEAIDYLMASRDMRLNTGDRQGVAETLYELGMIQKGRGETIDAKESFELSVKFSKESDSITRQLAPTVQLAILAYHEGDSEKGTTYLLSAREIASTSKQYELLTTLYAEGAREEYKNQNLMAAFLCWAEAIYMANFEDDRKVFDLFIEMYKDLLSLNDREIAGDFARRLIYYWHNLCTPPSTNSKFFNMISMSYSSSKTGEGALKVLDNIKNDLLG